MRLLALLGVLLLPALGSAQNLPSWATSPPPPAERGDGLADPSPDSGPILPPPPPPVPIDGGLGLLAVAGAAYAAHRLRRRTEDDEEA